jgi:hypothetical protein
MPHLARRTSHLHPICATESAAPPQEDSSLGQQLAPLAPEQRSTAQHSAAKRSVSWWWWWLWWQFSQVANAHSIKRRPRPTNERRHPTPAFWKEWPEEGRKGGGLEGRGKAWKEEGRRQRRRLVRQRTCLGHQFIFEPPMTKQRPCRMIGPAPCRLREWPERERSLSQASPCRTVPHRSLQTASRSPQGFSPNHRAPIVFWRPFWLLEDGEEPRSERRARQRHTHPQVPHRVTVAPGIWHLAPQTPPTSRAAMTDCHACEGPIAAYASLPQANAAARLLLGLQPYPAGGRCPE